jgi:hypothetical protein
VAAAGNPRAGQRSDKNRQIVHREQDEDSHTGDAVLDEGRHHRTAVTDSGHSPI